MNTHGIEIPPLPKFDRLSSMHADDVANLLSSYGRKCARAAIDADRKLHPEVGKNAKKRFESAMKGCKETDPIERLRFYCSLAMSGQDWLDAEPFFDALVADRKRRGEPVAWQPIETAPKDGSAILLSNERGAWIAKYAPVYPSGYRPENPWFSLMLNHDHMRKGKPYAPTHWMPLPPATPQPTEPVKCVACEGKPAPENNPCAVCGKESESVKVPSDAEILHELQSHGALATSNAICAVRVLLARYTNTKE